MLNVGTPSEPSRALRVGVANVVENLRGRPCRERCELDGEELFPNGGPEHCRPGARERSAQPASVHPPPHTRQRDLFCGRRRRTTPNPAGVVIERAGAYPDGVACAPTHDVDARAANDCTTEGMQRDASRGAAQIRCESAKDALASKTARLAAPTAKGRGSESRKHAPPGSPSHSLDATFSRSQMEADAACRTQ